MMEDKSRGWLFRKRNILGAVLVSGIIVGMYLPDFWKGFGGGTTVGVGIGDPASNSDDSNRKPTDDPQAKPVQPNSPAPVDGPPVIKVVIDERSYFIRSAEGDREVSLAEVVDLAKTATGDVDHFRVRIYRKADSRHTAEQALKKALEDAGISGNAVFWTPLPVK